MQSFSCVARLGSQRNGTISAASKIVGAALSFGRFHPGMYSCRGRQSISYQLEGLLLPLNIISLTMTSKSIQPP